MFVVTLLTLSNFEPRSVIKPLEYSEFLHALDEGHIEQVTIEENLLTGDFREGYAPATERGEMATKFITNKPNDEGLIDRLGESGVKFGAQRSGKDIWYVRLLSSWLPMLLLIGIFFFFMRQLQVGGGKALSFGKSKAKLLEEGAKKITFDDVAGIEESKNELEAVVSFLRDPKKFTKLGGKIPKGVLLVGNPGTGKTLLARAIAGEAGVPFFTISGSDFVEMFVGVGASRVRDLFLRAKKNAPCIVFIDEIDAVGRHRGAGLGGGHDEREQTLNQLLVEMDGFESNEGVILIAATNRPDVLDPALLRPGRFDRQVVVPLPDVRGREGILKVHSKKVPLDDNVDLEIVARGTPGFSGADLANLVNESALHAAFCDADKVTAEHFDYAKDKIMMGTERRSLALSDREKNVTAFHEAGHAIIAKLVSNADPVHKVTIVPRGMALGLMQQLPTDDRQTYTESYWLDRICIAFGGRVAEEITFNEISTGASSDIKAATNIAKKMVCEWGMSGDLGPLNYTKQDDQVFLGRDIGSQRDYSEETAGKIDEEVRRIVEEQLVRARVILKRNIKSLDVMAEALLEHETLDGEAVNEIMTQHGVEVEERGAGPA